MGILNVGGYSLGREWLNLDKALELLLIKKGIQNIVAIIHIVSNYLSLMKAAFVICTW